MTWKKIITWFENTLTSVLFRQQLEFRWRRVKLIISLSSDVFDVAARPPRPELEWDPKNEYFSTGEVLHVSCHSFELICAIETASTCFCGGIKRGVYFLSNYFVVPDADVFCSNWGSHRLRSTGMLCHTVYVFNQFYKVVIFFFNVKT